MEDTVKRDPAGLQEIDGGAVLGDDVHTTRHERRDPQVAVHVDLQPIGDVTLGLDSGKEGEIWTLGWNVSYGQLDAIDAGRQVVALDQKWSEQAGFGALACADLLANGILRPNTQELFPVTAANTAEARAELDAVLGG